MYVCLLLHLLASSCKLQATARQREREPPCVCVWVCACRFDNKQQVQAREAVQSKRAPHERVAVQLVCVCVVFQFPFRFVQTAEQPSRQCVVLRDKLFVFVKVHVAQFNSIYLCLSFSRLPAGAHALLSRAGGKGNICRQCLCQCCVCHCVISQCHSKWRE